MPGSDSLSGWRPGSGTRYYARDEGPDAEPGYSILAVSDPAADVTSTQTWQAVEDGRATGIWTMPRRPDAGSVPEAGVRRGSDQVTGTTVRRPGAHQAPAAADPPTPGAVPAQAAGAGAPPATGAAASASPEPRDGGVQGGRVQSGRRAARSPSTRRSGSSSRQTRPASVKFAIVVSVVLVIVAAAILADKVLHPAGKPGPAAGVAAQPAASATPAASPSQSLGPYGHIASRSSDPQPLTVQQLYPASFTISGSAVSQTASKLGKHCGSVLTGSKIQSAVAKAGCSQVVRATYLFSGKGLMGTIGVLNLSTAARATKLARSADASDYISPLAGRRGPTKKIGGGTGIEEAAAKGHYLILIWAEYTSLRRPKTAAQRTALVNFMSALLHSTANVSLSNRMLTGTP